MTTLAPSRPVAELTGSDKLCDRCGPFFDRDKANSRHSKTPSWSKTVPAQVVVDFPGGLRFAFCGSHFSSHRSKLEILENDGQVVLHRI